MDRQRISRKGCWTEEEDLILKDYVQKYGEGNWRHVSKATELKRCRKSCRLRWLNYLRPNINRDDFSGGEDDLILRLHKLLGNRWSLIAGRLPGRTANDVKNHWICSLSKTNRDGSTTGGCRVSIRKKKKRPENVGKIVKAEAKAVDETEQSERSRCLVSAGVKHPNEKGFEGEGDMISFWKGLLLKGEYIDFHNTTDLDEKLEVS